MSSNTVVSLSLLPEVVIVRLKELHFYFIAQPNLWAPIQATAWCPSDGRGWIFCRRDSDWVYVYGLLLSCYRGIATSVPVQIHSNTTSDDHDQDANPTAYSCHRQTFIRLCLGRCVKRGVSHKMSYLTVVPLWVKMNRLNVCTCDLTSLSNSPHHHHLQPLIVNMHRHVFRGWSLCTFSK